MVFKQSKSNAGFTLVEVLISLVIMGLLLSALAVAMSAAGNNYAENTDMVKAMNAARLAMLRITADLRGATAVAVIGAGGDIDQNQCSMVSSDGRDITYHYNRTGEPSYDVNLDDQTLYVVVNSGAAAGTYLLCENVTAMSFTRATVVDDPGVVRNVQISMTVTVGSASQTVSAAAVVRRNM